MIDIDDDINFDDIWMKLMIFRMIDIDDDINLDDISDEIDDIIND